MRVIENKYYHPDWIVKAKDLNEGGILSVYEDNGRIRMETVNGDDPYVWRNNKWIPMKEKR